MVFLADLDYKPEPRWKGLLIGASIALPVTLLFGSWALPRLRAAIINAATMHDTHARERDGYMGELCTTALVIERDEKVCGCILGAQTPSMDCMDSFLVWLTDRQVERCEDPATFDQALSFCSCVQALSEESEKVSEERAARRVKFRGYPRCLSLEDRLDYPLLETLAPSFVEAPN